MDDVAEALQSASVKVINKVSGNPDGESPLTNDAIQQANPLVASFFNINPNMVSNENKAKIDEIYEWANTKANGDELQITKVLKETKFKLGIPEVNEESINRIHRYIRLQTDAKKFSNQAKAMEAE